MNIKKTFLLLALALTLQSCSIFVGGPEYPPDPIPVSTQAVIDMRVQMMNAMAEGAQTGTVTLKITESQLTSYIAIMLEDQTDPPFTDPQIYLRDGQMKIYAIIKNGVFYANALIVVNVSVDEKGKPKIEIVSADFGSLDAPEGLNAAVSAIVDEAYTGSLGPVATGIRLETISIANGVMTLTGRIK